MDPPPPFLQSKSTDPVFGHLPVGEGLTSFSIRRQGGRSCLALECTQISHPTPQNKNWFLLLPGPPFNLSSNNPLLPSSQLLSSHL